jgi:hypothetical protein
MGAERIWWGLRLRIGLDLLSFDCPPMEYLPQARKSQNTTTFFRNFQKSTI